MRITGGQWASRTLAVPPGLGVRPTPDKVRQAIFNSLGPWIEGCTVLELFAGSGALSLECLSRSAISAVAVEKSSKHSSYIRRNAKALDTEMEIRVQCALQAVNQLAETGRTFDFICADPPYGEKTVLGKRSKSWAQKLLDETALTKILKPKGRLLVGHTKRDAIEIPDPWREYKTLKHGDTWIRVLKCAAGILPAES